MSFSATAPQILDRSQTITRRVGWRLLKPGDLVQAVGPATGRGVAGPLAVLRVRTVRVEPLSRLVTDPAYAEDELPREGYPCWLRDEFVDAFCRANRLRTTDVEITRIEFEHAQPAATTGHPTAPVRDNARVRRMCPHP